MSRFAVSMAVLLSVILVGCQQQTRRVTSVAANLVSAVSDEEIATQNRPILLSIFGGVSREPELERFLGRVLRTITQTTDVAGPNVKITLLNTGSVRAFAMPGGEIFLSRSLVGLMSSEAEIAGIIAHELAQIELGHARTTYLAREPETALDLAMEEIPRTSDIARGVALLRQPFFAPYSSDEVERADRLAAQWLADSGYDPQALVTGIAALEAYEIGTDRPVAYFDTHPRSQDSVAFALSEVEFPPTARAIERALFVNQLDGLVMDDDARIGVVDQGAFISLDRDVEFEVPDEFSVFGGDSAVIGSDGGRAAMIFDIDIPVSIPNNLRLYLRDGFVRFLSLRDVEDIRVNGRPGATGKSRVRTKQGEVEIRVAVVRMDQNRLGRFVFLSDETSNSLYARQFRRTLFSLAPSAGENSLPRPARIQVLPSGGGNDVEAFAGRMEVDGDRSTIFRAINGLSTGGGLVANQPIKLLVR